MFGNSPRQTQFLNIESGFATGKSHDFMIQIVMSS